MPMTGTHRLANESGTLVRLRFQKKYLRQESNLQHADSKSAFSTSWNTQALKI